jgi:Bacterial aa3 type cytochrome c oxidase subunit IV
MVTNTSKGHPAMDYAEHNRTYHGFLRGSVVLIVLVVCILLGMLVALT